MSATLPASVLDPFRKRSPEMALAHARRAGAREGWTAGRDAERDDAYEQSWRPLLNRRSRPAYVKALIPEWARARHAAETAAQSGGME